jgi:hypothetical protein
MKDAIVKITCLMSLFLLTSMIVPFQAYADDETTTIWEGEAHTGWHGLYPVIESFLQSVRSGKIEEAYNNFTTEQFRKKTSLDEFKNIVNEAVVLKDNKLFKFLSFYFDNRVAIFQGSLISTHGDSLQTEFDMKPEGSSWKIDGIHLFKPEIINPPREDEYQPPNDNSSNALITPKKKRL